VLAAERVTLAQCAGPQTDVQDTEWICQTRRLARQLERFGHHVTLEPAVQAA
jgi:hypothetical protein